MSVEILKRKLGGAAKGVVATVVILGFLGVAAWITHVIDCLKDGEWGFLIAGALMFPIAIIHGIGVWFGFW